MDVWDVPAVFLPTSYIVPIQRAGASIVALPPQDTDPVGDGLVVSAWGDDVAIETVEESSATRRAHS